MSLAPTANGKTSTNDTGSTGSAVGKPPNPPSFSSREKEREYLKFRLAQAFRIFGKLGYDEGVAGHITVRDPIRTDCFWVNPFGKHFSLIQPNDLLLVNHQGAVQLAESVHGARPDVLCAAHSHSIYGRAFSTLGKELDMITQDSCAFYNDHGVYRQYGGVVLDEEEGARIVEALGSKKAVILQNHGLLVTGSSIEATVYRFVALEKSCQVQLMADAAAAGTGVQTIKIPPEECALAHSVVGSIHDGWFSGLPHFQLLEAEEGVSFDMGSK